MINIFLDGADLNAMREWRKNELVKGFTSNPALMRAAGVTDYESFAREAVEIADGLPISFEVISDEWDEMEKQARKIASWGKNIYVKIPVTNTKGESAAPLVRKLSDSGITCNVTAVFTDEQVGEILSEVNPNDPIIISVFCGRIADTSRFPSRPELFGQRRHNVKYLWASTRQILNILQAEKQNFDIITVPPLLLKKYEELKDKDLNEFSLDTVKLFYEDARKAGYVL